MTTSTSIYGAASIKIDQGEAADGTRWTTISVTDDAGKRVGEVHLFAEDFRERHVRIIDKTPRAPIAADNATCVGAYFAALNRPVTYGEGV